MNYIKKHRELIFLELLIITLYTFVIKDKEPYYILPALFLCMCVIVGILIFIEIQLKPKPKDLSSITIEQAAHVLRLTFFAHVQYPISDYKFYLNAAGNPTIRISNSAFEENLTFGIKTGSIWAIGKPSNHVKIPAAVYKYLREEGFTVYQ